MGCRKTWFIVFLFIVQLTQTSCVSGLKEFEEFSTISTVDIPIRLSGVYIYKSAIISKYYGYFPVKYIEPIFFYSDHSVLILPYFKSVSENANAALDSTRNTYLSAMDSLSSFLHSRKVHETILPNFPRWGKVRFDQDTLIIKFFDLGPSNMGDRVLSTSYYKILNDTTINQIYYKYYHYCPT